MTFHLAVLSSFALAQPLFNLIAASPEFLVAHRLGPGFLIVLMGLLVLGPPALVLLVVGLGGSLHAQIRNVAVGVGVAGFTCCFWLPVLKRWPEEPGWLVLLLAAVIGIGVGNCYLRFHTVRLFISFLSPGLLLFPVLFLAQPPITKLLFRAVPADTVATEIDSQTPVVLAVFDQLPLASLLDSRKQIDAKLFPHFAELARGSIWFRNATTVSDITRHALPAILTGNYPRPALLPTTADNPKNLFTFLGPAYNLKVVEPITALCPEDLCQRTEKSSGARLWTLLVDLSITYFHILAPADYAHLMPPSDQKWMDFASETVQDANQAWIVERSRDRRQGPLRFIEAIRADDPQPTLYFLHSLLPHEPYLLLPSGRFYGPTQNLTGLLHGERWTTEALAVDLSYQRHLMQVRYADQLLGKLMERLRTVNIYEKSMLVVTADHGASFRPGDLFKKPTRTNFPDIMAVPLMIKLPQQRDGYIDDSNVETIDVLPTIAQTLGTRLPWVTDGKPVTEAQPAQRSHKTIFFDDATRSLRVAPEELEIKYQTALRKYRLPGQQAADSSWSPVHQELIGRELASLDVEEDDRIRARLLYPGFFQEVSPGGDFIPCLISGYVERAGDSPVDLALAINGIIQATTRTYGLSTGAGRKGAWEALVPESAFIAGPNLVEILTIRNSESGPRLFRAYSSMQARPSADNLVLEVAQWRWGVEFSGFYSQEWWQDRPARWTDGNASLSIRVDPTNPPLARRLKLLHAGPRGTSLRVLADGCPLWDRKLPPGEASLSIAFADCPPNSDRLKIELVSGTFVPEEVDPASLDKRRLGVALESLNLTRSEGRSKPDQ